MSVRNLLLGIATLAVLLMATPSWAASMLFFIGGTDDNNYNNPANWDLRRVPGYRDHAYVTTGRTAKVSSSVTGPAALFVGYYTAGNGELDVQTGASFNPSGVYLGVNGDSTQGAKGTIVQTGGMLSTNALVLGTAISQGLAGGTGTYTISAGTLNAVMPGGFGSLHIGDEGYGTLTQTGGSVFVADGCTVGSNGVYNMSGGSLDCTLPGHYYTPVGTYIAGAMNQTGGIISVWRATCNGVYTLNAGSLFVSGTLTIGQGDSVTGGLFVQNGGAVNVARLDISPIWIPSHPLNVVYNLNGGVLTIQGPSLAGPSVIIDGGTLNISNGTLQVNRNSINGYPSEGAGTITMSGGTITNVGNIEPSISLPSGGNATFFQQPGAAGTLSGVISGEGNLTKAASGTLYLNGANTYTGNTTVSAGVLTISGSSLVKVSNSALSSKFLGTGGLNLNGGLYFDVAGVSESSDTWHVVDVANLSESFGGAFAVGIYGGSAFTNASGVWSYTDTVAHKVWTFTQSTGDLTLAASITYLQGDADKNGTVNSNDLGLLLTHYNQTISTGVDGWAWGDFNGDGTVNSNDLGLLLTHYNQTVAATSAVPEPSTLLLAVAGLLGLLAYAWRKK